MANYIGVYLDKGLTLKESIEKCLEILEGAYSIVLISILDPLSMYIFKNTGTMVIGVSESLQKDDQIKSQEHAFQIVSSDTTVF